MEVLKYAIILKKADTLGKAKKRAAPKSVRNRAEFKLITRRQQGFWYEANSIWYESFIYRYKRSARLTRQITPAGPNCNTG
jgi:hypothetical protein